MPVRPLAETSTEEPLSAPLQRPDAAMSPESEISFQVAVAALAILTAAWWDGAVLTLAMFIICSGFWLAWQLQQKPKGELPPSAPSERGGGVERSEAAMANPELGGVWYNYGANVDTIITQTGDELVARSPGEPWSPARGHVRGSALQLRDRFGKVHQGTWTHGMIRFADGNVLKRRDVGGRGTHAGPSQGPADPELMRSTADITSLVRALDVCGALKLEKAQQLLRSPAVCSEHVELRWLREIAPLASGMMERLVVPPQGGGWAGPFEHEEAGNWKIQFWYKWTQQDVLTTITKTTIRGTFEQGAALLYESDLEHNWLPCVTEGVSSWSAEVPALLVDFRAKVPILPRIISTLLHRCFLHHAAPGGGPGLAILDWTPAPEKLVDGWFCGMRVPQAPERSIRGGVRLATSIMQPEGLRHFSMISVVENNFPRKLCPEFLVRPFFKLNSRICAQRMYACIQDFEARGYLRRVRQDRLNFYAHLRRHAAACASNSAGSSQG